MNIIKISDGKPVNQAARAHLKAVGSTIEAWWCMPFDPRNPKVTPIRFGNVTMGQIWHMHAPAVIEPLESRTGVYAFFADNTSGTASFVPGVTTTP